VKVVVLGAGLIGVASAYYLWRDGHEVHVIEQHEAAASVTSYANACLLSASRALPWPTPTARSTIWRALTDASAPMRITKLFDPALWSWGVEFLSYANAKDYERLSRAKLAFAHFCHDELHQVVAETSISCGLQRSGLLYVCRTESTLEAARARSAWVAQFGSQLDILSRDQAIAKEPALANTEFVGASFAPDDGQGDSRRFTRELVVWLQARGVQLHFNETALGVESVGAQLKRVNTTKQVRTCDALVAALGPATPHFAKVIGQRMPIYPVKGYSLTVPVRDTSLVPKRGGICEDSLIAYCPLDDGRRMRITTGAEFAGFKHDAGGARSGRFNVDDFAPHRNHFESLFPGALDWNDVDNIEFWSCARPMTPSTLPILQARGYENLFWNCGQGHIGWTMSCGSGRVISDLVAKRVPSFDLTDMQRV
jgi:D-amino-acid dehydrogenase